SSGVCRIPAVYLPFAKFNNNVFVQWTVRGNVPATFLVDTGCTTSMLDLAELKRLHLSADSSKGSKPARITLSDLHLAHYDVAPVTFRVGDLSQLRSERGRVAGIIGEDILKQFVVTFDYGNKFVEFDPPNCVTVPNGCAVLKARHTQDGSGMVF